VFEGEPTDIAVSYYVNDERIRGGGIYEVRSRAISPSATKYWLRRIHYNHLLPEDNPLRAGMVGPSAFQELQIPEDSEIDFVGNLLMVTLRSDWSPEPGKNFIRGSIVNVNAHKFLKYGPADRIYHVLFQPSRRVACENYAVTKNFVILSLLDNLRSRLEFYKLEKDGNKLRMIGSDKNPVIRMAIVRAVDPNENDNFWLTTSGYIEPTTLWLGDAAKMDTGDKTVIRKTGSVGYIVRKLKALPAQFDAKDLEVAQKICTSKDGTEIPYFIVKKRGVVLDKSNRTLLYGYGGFDVSVAPHYVGPTGIAWLERDGVYVEASIRGGGEFGPTWHEVSVQKNCG
jgi:prolyl oligopeptidase